jgi:hypothetical protein
MADVINPRAPVIRGVTVRGANLRSPAATSMSSEDFMRFSVLSLDLMRFSFCCCLCSRSSASSDALVHNIIIIFNSTSPDNKILVTTALATRSNDHHKYYKNNCPVWCMIQHLIWNNRLLILYLAIDFRKMTADWGWITSILTNFLAQLYLLCPEQQLHTSFASSMLPVPSAFLSSVSTFFVEAARRPTSATCRSNLKHKRVQWFDLIFKLD